MKKRGIVLGAIAVIAVVSIGGYAFAQDTNGSIFRNNQARFGVMERLGFGNNSDHCVNNKDMIEIMENSEFQDMVRWMKEGNFEAMDQFMNNLSEEDFQKMIDLMSENGYGNMSRMMSELGREGMINMHNSMMRGNGSRFNMMRQFR